MSLRRLCYILPALVLLAVSCSREKGTSVEKPTVLVTVAPLAYFAQGIGGDRVNVEILAPSGSDPETFEPSMATLRNAAHARVMLTTGLLPFEEVVAQTVSASAADNIVIQSLADSLHLITGTHGHDEADPHIWMSLRNARIMARTTCRALVEAMPADSVYFCNRLINMEHRIDSLDNLISLATAMLKSRTFLVWHPSLSYFARDYGLRQIAVGAENKETSIGALRQRLERVKYENATVFFGQKELDTRQLAAISEVTGLQPVIIAPMDTDIEATLTGASETLTYTK